jgi:ABC-type Fe3+/spermidine/putrescine transport system ATPase subunit
MSDVLLEQVRKSYGAVVAVRSLDLRVAPGEFVTLLGPSGCGKTTCLRMVAGFVGPDAGRILLGGQDVTHVPPYRRNTGMVFQSYALFPHRTVAANIAFGMQMRGVTRGDADRRTREALRLVQLDQLADRYPAELSGGQKQRVALARAVVIRPEVLLLDEPLGALDLKLREELQVEIKRVQSELGITTLFVTHDQGEALGMSDRVAVMRDGKIVQIDTPSALYERPNSTYSRTSSVGPISSTWW